MKSPSNADRISSLHIARTTLAAAASALIAHACHLPEPMWAIITAFVVTQSSLGATWEVSRQRLAGSILGSILGALLAISFRHDLLVLMIGAFVMGWICKFLRLSHSAYRFAGVTLVIIAMPRYDNPSWVAVHRCLEVCVGIVCGMAVLAVWRSRADSATAAIPAPPFASAVTQEPVSEPEKSLI